MKLLLPPSNSTSRPVRGWGSAWLIPLLIPLLVLCLLLSQMLGQLHAVKHGGPAGVDQAAAANHHHEPHDSHDSHEAHDVHDARNAHSAPAGGDFEEQLFPLHSSHADCRLYDQACMSDALPGVAAVIVPPQVPSFLVAIFQGEAIARWAALFDARGPPLTV